MKNKKDFMYLHRQMKNNYHYFFISIIFILLGAFFEFFGPRLIGVTIDSIIGNSPFDLPVFLVDIINLIGGKEFILANIFLVSFTFIIITLFSVSCERIRLKATNILGENVGYNMRKDIFNSLQSATFAYHKNIKTGDIIQRCSTDIDIVRNFILEFNNLIRICAKIIVAYIFMFGISFNLAFISFITIPLITIVSIIFNSRVIKKFTEADEAEGKMSAQVQENLTAPRVIRAFARQKGEVEDFDKKNQIFADLWIKVGDLLTIFWASTGAFAIVQEMTVICFAILFSASGSISPGEVITFMIFNSMLSQPISMVGRLVGNMSKAVVAINRISEVSYCDKEDFNKGLDFVFENEIEFKDVHFSFDNEVIFNGLSFKIKKGETVAILGASGSGKTTILSLLARFYDVETGEILVDGVNINQISITSLRQNIGMVMQEPFLFSKTISQNIAFSSANINHNKVISCAKISDIDESIQKFTNGYDTLIGEKGVTVSGGQKQRIAIARALYADANILCFDDSLSAVDTVTDLRIRKNLKENMIDMTQIIISQRISTLMGANNIIVIAHGNVIESGNHDYLCNLNGIYSEIVHIQQDIIDQTNMEAGE